MLPQREAAENLRKQQEVAQAKKLEEKKKRRVLCREKNLFQLLKFRDREYVQLQIACLCSHRFARLLLRPDADLQMNCASWCAP